MDHWISKVSQNFGDAALDEQNTYLPEALLERVGTLYALDLTAQRILGRLGLDHQLIALHQMFERFSSSLALAFARLHSDIHLEL